MIARKHAGDKGHKDTVEVGHIKCVRGGYWLGYDDERGGGGREEPVGMESTLGRPRCRGGLGVDSR